MQIIRKVVSFIMILMMLLPLTAHNINAANISEQTDGYSDLSAFAKSIPQLVTQIQKDNTLAEKDKIEALLNLLFNAKKDQYIHSTSDNIDFSVFWSKQPSKSDNLLYFERSVQAEKETFNMFGQYAGDCTTEINFRSISIDGQTAKVVVYEWLEYNLRSISDNTLCWPSTEGIKTGVGIPYTFTFENDNGCWLISDIEFYNDATELLRNQNISVQSALQQRYTTATTVRTCPLITFENSASPKGSVLPPGLPIATELDTTRFCYYANRYAGSNRNPLFVSFSADCQNYASQCLWYGLGGNNTQIAITTAYKPMIDSQTTSNTARHWYHSAGGAHTASWTEVNSFYNYVLAGSSNTMGLYGSYAAGVAYAQVGDIIQIRAAGATLYDHSFVVVATSGSYGQRTTRDITVCAHTTDRTATRLSDIIYSDERLRTIHINGVITLTE